MSVRAVVVTLVLLPSFSFLSHVVVGQAQWQLIHPYPQGGNITSQAFVDSLHGWFVTENGSIWKTTDGGASWLIQRQPSGTRLSSVAMVNIQHGWAGGNQNLLLRTTNSGLTWFQSHPWIPFETINRIKFVSPTSGWIATSRGAIYRTIPSEEFWSKSFQWPLEWDDDILVPPGPIVGISAVDSLVCWAIGRRTFRPHILGNIIMRTTNGGATWDTIRINFPGYVTDICFTSPTRGWYLSDSATIVGTTDAGSSWRVEYDGRTTSFDPLLDMERSGTTRAWAVGRYGLVVKTLDGGNTWTQGIVSSLSSTLESVHLIDGNQGWTAGGYGMIFKTTDGGTTWTSLYRGTPVQFRGVDFVTPQRGWATTASSDIGYAGVYATEDSGFTWSPQLLSSTGLFIGIQMVDSLNGWVVGQLSGGSAVFRTTNGGAVWENAGIQLGFGAHGVKFANPQDGWIYGGPSPGTYQQAVLRTTDGGSNWSSVLIDTATFTSTVTDLAYLDPLHVWCVNQQGIYRSVDGGGSWQHIYVDPGNPVKLSLTFANFSDGWMSGVGGIILRTTDGGFTWMPQSSGVTTQLQKIRFLDGQRGWAVGLGQGVHTSDGGLTWVRTTLPTLTSLFDIQLLREQDRFFAWSVGWEGTVVRLHDLLTGVDEPRPAELPSGQALYQNFPNPFNPVTTIRFKVQESGYVTLKVYDVLGREVATLVDEKRPAGEHSVQLNATGLSSGVYFCRMQAGRFTETRNLLLMK